MRGKESGEASPSELTANGMQLSPNCYPVEPVMIEENPEALATDGHLSLTLPRTASSLEVLVWGLSPTASAHYPVFSVGGGGPGLSLVQRAISKKGERKSNERDHTA